MLFTDDMIMLWSDAAVRTTADWLIDVHIRSPMYVVGGQSHTKCEGLSSACKIEITLMSSRDL